MPLHLSIAGVASGNSSSFVGGTVLGVETMDKEGADVDITVRVKKLQDTLFPVCSKGICTYSFKSRA